MVKIPLAVRTVNGLVRAAGNADHPQVYTDGGGPLYYRRGMSVLRNERESEYVFQIQVAPRSFASVLFYVTGTEAFFVFLLLKKKEKIHGYHQYHPHRTRHGMLACLKKSQINFIIHIKYIFKPKGILIK